MQLVLVMDAGSFDTFFVQHQGQSSHRNLSSQEEQATQEQPMKAGKNLLAAGVMAAALLVIPTTHANALQGPPPPGYGAEPWAAVPPELQGAERQGFHEGIEGARKDYENHRPPSVENRDEFRHPPVPHRDREAYRQGFRRGYQVGVDHLMHGMR